MARITYLFGAGASASALPVVKDINKKIELVIEYYKSISSLKLLERSDDEFNASEARDKLIEDFNWLLIENSRHASIDTFAKKLFVNQKYYELNKLKILISVFFSFLQVKNPIDPRYDHFFASIIGKTNKDLPKDISILSWNYDNQFELAYREFINHHNIEVQETFLGIQNNPEQSNYEVDKFKIFKINGTSGNFFLNKSCIKFINRIDYNFDEEFLIKRLLERYYYLIKRIEFPNIKSSISFAWENEEKENWVIENAKREVQNCQTLVIIGYSIPFFNRKIDKEILQNMDLLSSIYIQDKYPENIESRLEQLIPKHVLSEIEIKHSKDLDQFLIPYEL